MTVDIQVTQADIDSSETKSCWACPVAKAVKRSLALPDSVRVQVGGTPYLVRLHLPERKVDLDLPGEARRFLALFDHSHLSTPQPLKFKLRVADDLAPVLGLIPA